MKKILMSPGYGAGWATWAEPEQGKFVAEYQPIIEWLEEASDIEDLIKRRLELSKQSVHRGGITLPIAEQFLNDLEAEFGPEGRSFYFGGARDLEVVEIPDDAQYRIDEYDGYESLTLRDSEVWW